MPVFYCASAGGQKATVSQALFSSLPVPGAVNDPAQVLACWLAAALKMNRK